MKNRLTYLIAQMEKDDAEKIETLTGVIAIGGYLREVAADEEQRDPKFHAIARRVVLLAAGCPWHFQAGQALRGDPPRLIDHLVNDITCRFDLADQAHTLTPRSGGIRATHSPQGDRHRRPMA